MDAENRRLLIEGSKSFGLSLEGKRVEDFDLYLRELLRWNQKINLTAVRTEKEVVVKHFLDSLSTSPYLPETASLLDIGSGAGFPGIPIKIVKPLLRVTLVDSVRKKVDFQRHLIRTLGLKEIEAVHTRVHEQGVPEPYRERFDVVVSRAFSDLGTFLKLSYPFLRAGGIALAMKGRWEEEESRLGPEAGKPSYEPKGMHTFLLPFSRYERSLLLFEKR
jgi:16S rRNA (guanine527-N7)-methyltransferase